LIRPALLLLLAAEVLAAQTLHLGEPFPLTSTRYGTARGHHPLLLSNGVDPVVFWTDGRYVRAVRVGSGIVSPSRVILEANTGEPSYDAVWTGHQFLVVAGTRDVVGGTGNQVAARLVAANGEPLGAPFTIVAGGLPHVAFNGRNVLLIYTEPFSTQVNTLLLTANGNVVASPRLSGMRADGRVAVASNGSTFAAVVPRALEPRLLQFDGSGNLTSETILGTYGSSATIATDGRRYLAVGACGEGGPCSPAYTRLVDADGSVGPAVEHDALLPPFPFQPSAVWSGSEWVVAYIRGLSGTTGMLNVFHLDAKTAAISKREQQSAVESSLTAVGGRVLAAWVASRFYDTIYVAGLPLGSGVVTPVSIAPTFQILPVAATSANGTLVAWQELGSGVTTLYTGFRAAGGAWTERPIFSFPPNDCYYCYETTVNAYAAGDGNEFILVSGLELRRLDAAGAPIGNPIALPPLSIQQLLWSGRDYFLLNYERITRLSPAGAITASVPMPKPIGQAFTFASDGSGGLLAVWVNRFISEFEQRTTGLFAVRLDRDLQPIDMTPIELTSDDPAITASSATWDGQQYVVAWSGAKGVKAARFAATGAAMPKITQISTDLSSQTDVVPIRDGVAVRWFYYNGANTVAFLHRDGTVTAPAVVSAPGTPGTVAALPNGDAAYVDQAVLASYESSMRLTMRTISEAALPSKPDAPRLSAQQSTLTWSAPPQPVSGYRVEMRRGDEPWVELEPVLAPEVHALVVNNGAAAYRVRAWNEAGLGALSNSVALGAVRRRASRP
jgi:hypothetical protein